MAANRSMTATVSLSTDPRTSHIGRYFIDIRDTTHVEDRTRPSVGRQMTTRIKDAEPARKLISELRDRCAAEGIAFNAIDDTLDNLGL